MPVNKCTQTKDIDRLSEVVERSKKPPKEKAYWEVKFENISQVVPYINQHTAELLRSAEFVEVDDPLFPIPEKAWPRFWDQKVTIQDKDGGKPKKISVWEYWKGSEERRRYYKVDFRPDIEEEEFYVPFKMRNGKIRKRKILNCWKGLQVEPIEGDFPTIRRHLFEIIANEREGAYEWLMNHFALLVQHPADRAAMLVMKSDEGAGKGVIDAILARIFGVAYAQLDVHSIAGQFNAAIFGKSVIHLNESCGTTQGEEGAIKRILTEDQIMINRKFRNTTHIKNTARIIVSSNKDTPVSVEAKTRRIVTLEVSNKLVYSTDGEQREYFQPLYESVKEGEKDEVPQFLHHLLNRDLTHFKGLVVPEFATDAAFSSIMSGKNSYWKWLHAVLSYGSIYMGAGDTHNESINWHPKVHLEACNRKYLEYCNENRLQPIHEAQRGKIHGKAFGEVLGSRKKGGRSIAKTMDKSSPPNRLWPSSLEEGRRLFAKLLGVSVEACFEDE